MEKGFTLLELLIVIAILAILATVTFVVLNPAQLLAQARDAQRIAELGSIRNAINLYLTAPVSSSTSVDMLEATQPSGTTCFTHVDLTPNGSGCKGTGVSARHGTKTAFATTSRAIDGTGWIPVNFGDTSGGSALATLPIDPINSTLLFYSYAAASSTKTFEIDAHMESNAYQNGGAKDVESRDGGNSTSTYEVGSQPLLNI